MMEKLIHLDVLIRRILPQVIPCPKSMVFDALQSVVVEFCKESGVWTKCLQETVFPGESCIDIIPGNNIVPVRIINVWVDGTQLSKGSVSLEDNKLFFEDGPYNKEAHVSIHAVVRPSRFAELIPEKIVEEWGDVLAYGALAKIKAMSGTKIEWSDGQGASIALQQYNEGLSRAKSRSIRVKNGDGPLLAV